MHLGWQVSVFPWTIPEWNGQPKEVLMTRPWTPSVPRACLIHVATAPFPPLFVNYHSYLKPSLFVCDPSHIFPHWRDFQNCIIFTSSIYNLILNILMLIGKYEGETCVSVICKWLSCYQLCICFGLYRWKNTLYSSIDFFYFDVVYIQFICTIVKDIHAFVNKIASRLLK